MSIQSIAQSYRARLKLHLWYSTNFNNISGMDHLFLNEMRFITDNPTKARTRQWLFNRFPSMVGSI